MRKISILLACCAATSAWGQFAPPQEFDHAYDGRVHVEEVATQDDIRTRVCSRWKYPGQALGCSQVIARICVIFKVSDQEIRAAGHDPDVFMRHEIAHCNGWPNHHPGIR